ncbi:hypothetical protein PMI16_02149 [Herbaspirillum sp. CF444]|uniref:hypothetical protein n=1 Tax=Herbaspirillum sp. CF444 TaxID=1144319 RepID=UPI00027268D8|nr:hypothetical protein [Herbaspirillum sp. CF444]EJL88505.1 hypothetical protein PMI16_02149 [Herbaspirillum sp. CF444]
MAQTATWDKVMNLTALEVRTGQGGAPLIYRNGKHQAYVDVFVTAVDANRTVVDLSGTDLSNVVQLVEFNTLEVLGGHGYKGWAAAFEDSGYVTENVPNVVVPTTGVGHNRIRFYVRCDADTTQPTMLVAAQVSWNPEGKEANRKTFSTAHGGTNGLESSVTITTTPAIDYSKSEHWEVVSDGDWHNVIRELDYRSMVRSSGEAQSWNNHYGGTSEWKKFLIRSMPAKNNGMKFRRTHVTKGAVDNIKSRLDSNTSFGHDTNFRIEPFNYAHAVSGSTGSDNEDVLVWFVKPVPDFIVGIAAGSSLPYKSANHWLELYIGSKDDRHHITPDHNKDDSIAVYAWHLSFPWTGFTRYWQGGDSPRSDMFIHDAVVDVEDDHGNAGKLTVQFDADPVWPVMPKLRPE